MTTPVFKTALDLQKQSAATQKLDSLFGYASPQLQTPFKLRAYQEMQNIFLKPEKFPLKDKVSYLFLFSSVPI